MVVLVLAALLVASAFLPAVQTWIAQTAIARRPGLQMTLGSLSAGMSGVELADVNLKTDAGVLTLPSIAATLPLLNSVRGHKLVIRSLVAKGWTLDLTHAPEAENTRTRAVATVRAAGDEKATPAANAVSAQTTARIFEGIFGDWKFPCEFSLDEVDLEGDVMLATSPAAEPFRVHVVIKGGGISAGHAGTFAIDASILDPRFPGNSGVAQGRVVVAMKTPRAFERVDLEADFSTKSGRGPPADDFTCTIDAAAAREIGDELYTLDLIRGGRHLATIKARFVRATGQLAGKWTIDLRDSDVAPFALNHPLPDVTAAGEGQFDWDPRSTRLHAVGELKTVANHLGGIAPRLEPAGELSLAASFDLAQTGQSLHVNRLNASLGATQSIAEIHSRQSFDWSEKTGKFKVADPDGDWLEGAFREFPLAWLSAPTDWLGFTRGRASGEFVVKATDEGFALHMKQAFAATGISVQKGGRIVAQGLDVSAPLRANTTPRGWELQCSPLTIGSAGKQLAVIEAKVDRVSGAELPIAVNGTWKADLDNLNSRAAFPEMDWLTARSASGDFSGKMGAWTEWEGNLTVVGHDPTHRATAKLRAEIDADGSGTLVAPLEFAFGHDISDTSVDADWRTGEKRQWVELKLTGKDAAVEHLRLLAAPLAAAGGVPFRTNKTARGATAASADLTRDRVPFWGDWIGRATIAFNRLRWGKDDYGDVGGTVKVDHGLLELFGGRGGLPHHRLEQVEGTIAFDPAAEFPYHAKADAASVDVDATALFAAEKKGKDPVLEGRFKIESSLVGKGRTLDDLVKHTQEEFRLKSTNGIVRLLKTDVAQALPSAPSSRVSDALIDAGSLVGKIFGAREKSVVSGETPVGKTTEAVLDFTYETAEIGYDDMAIKAIRDADGTIRLVEIAVNAKDERLTGSGRLAHVAGLSLFAQPLSLDLQLGTRGRAADLLAKAGLLSSRKDDAGYAMLDGTLHFGGSLEHIDDSAWRGLLVEAAMRKPAGGKKGG